MKDYVLDANAVLFYLGEENPSAAEKVATLFKEARAGCARLLMSVGNLGEVVYILMKRTGEEGALRTVNTLQHAVSMIGVDPDRAIRAATLKHHLKLGYADSYAAALALETHTTLVSADPAFERLGKSLKWLRLPHSRSNRPRAHARFRVRQG